MKTRVLFSTGVFPPNIGGPGKIVEGLPDELTKQDYNASVITFGNRDNVQRTYKIERVSFSIPQPLRSFILLIKTLILSLKSDVLYATDNYSTGLSAAIASKLFHKPMIARFTGDSVWESAFNQGKTTLYITDFQNQKHDLLTRIKIWRRNFILKTAKRIITDCEFLKNLVSSFGINPNKIIVINNAADQNTETGLERKKNIIFTMARLVPWKGIDTLIRIMPDIQKQIPDAKLLVAGDGPQMSELQQLAQKLNLINSVQLLGKVTDKDEKQKLYSQSSVFVINTFYEGMSNTLTEAMAAGLPIIATRAGGNMEFVNDSNGILIDYNNSQQIKEAVIELLSNPQKAEQLGHTAKQAAKQYTWDTLVEKNIKLINEVLER